MTDGIFVLLFVGFALAIILVLACAPDAEPEPAPEPVCIPPAERVGDDAQSARMARARAVLAAYTAPQFTGYPDLDRVIAERSTREQVGYVWMPEDVRTRLDAGIEAGRRRETYYGERHVASQPRPQRRSFLEAVFGQ